MVRIARAIANGDRGEDRVAVRLTPDGVVVVVADGAGGVGGAAQAAQSVCETLASRASGSERTAAFWTTAIYEIDRLLSASATGGLSTAVVLEVASELVFGASVGDSGARMISPTHVLDLTKHQSRKPLVGSGGARPVGFGPLPVEGRLLVASDGLFKYSATQELASRALQGTLDEAVQRLVDSVRLPSGGLQDDVAVVLCEVSGIHSDGRQG